MKYSAVEWLESEFLIANGKLTFKEFEQAKEMFEQQIIDALHYFGIENAEQYYNETFKTNG